MPDISSLIIEVDSKGAVKADKNLEALERQSGRTEKATDKVADASKRSATSFIRMAAKIGAAMLAYRAITGVTRSFIENTIKQEQAMRQLEIAVESTGGAAGVTAEEMREMAQGLQQVTTFGDEAIMEMQAILLTFTQLGKEVLPQTTEAVLNMSIRMGVDMKSAALQLGKALNDPILGLTALSRAGIQFTTEQKDTIKSMVEANDTLGAQKMILRELEVQFGGSAKAARDTFGGALESLGNTFGDLFEASEKTSKSMANIINAMNDGLKASGFYEAAVKGLAEAMFQLSDASDDAEEKLIDASKGAWNLKQNLDNIVNINREGGIIEKALYGGPEKQARAQKLFDEKIAQMRALAAGLTVIEPDAGGNGDDDGDDLAAKAEERAAAQAEIDAAIEQGAAIHFGIMHQLEADAITESQAARDKAAKDKKATTEKELSGLIGMAMAGNKSMTELVRQAAIEQAKTKGKQAIINSYEAGTKVGGPFMGAIYAGAASLAVGGLINALKGGGEGTAAPAATVSTIPTPEAPAQQVAAPQEQRGQAVVQIFGNVYGDAADTIIEEIRDKLDNQDVVLFGQDSRQAQELT